MSKFYHAFTIGFNWWYLALPATFVAMALIGRLSVRIRIGSKFILIRATSSNFDKFVCLLATIGVCRLMVVESGAGLLQLMDNIMGSDYGDPTGIYTLITAGVVFIVAVGVIYIAMLATYCYAKERKLYGLKKALKHARISYRVRRDKSLITSLVKLYRDLTAPRAKESKVVDFQEAVAEKTASRF